MASEQLRRRENKQADDHARELQVEKDRVNKMASHFESLAEKVKSPGARDHHESGAGDVKSVDVVVETRAHRGGGQAHGVEQTSHGVEEGLRGVDQRKGPSLEEIGRARGAAQENSMLAIRAAEERYQKAKNLGGSAGENVQQSAGTDMKSASQGAQATLQIAAEKAAKAKDYTKEIAGQVTDVVGEKAMGLKNTVVDVSKKAVGYTGEEAAAAKDVKVERGDNTTGYAGQAAQAVRDRSGQAAGYAGEKAAAAKDATMETGKTTAGYVGQTAQAVKEKAGKATGYVGEKAVAAKDVTMETGKSTAGYVGQVAETVKDKTMLAGWAAAEYTADKIVGATEAVANVTSGVAGYAGEKAVAAKDVVAGAGQKTMGYAGEKLVAVKDSVVATEESAKDYAARKRAEKEREVEAKKSYQSKSEGGGVGATEENKGVSGAAGKISEQVRDALEGESRDKYQPGEQVLGKENKGQERGRGGKGVLGVIGETIVEIGQTTKDLIIGQGEGEAGGVQASCGGASQGTGKHCVYPSTRNEAIVETEETFLCFSLWRALPYFRTRF